MNGEDIIDHNRIDDILDMLAYHLSGDLIYVRDVQYMGIRIELRYKVSRNDLANIST